MMAMDEERFEELAARDALGDLSAGERAELEAELARRGAAGLAVVRRYREVAAALALGAPMAPPPELRDRLLATVRADRGGTGDPVDGEPLVTPLPRRRSWAWAAAASIAALIVAALAVWGNGLREENAALRAELERTRSELATADASRSELSAADAARSELDSLRAGLASLRADLAFVAGPDAAVHGLTGTGVLPTGRARVFLDPATGRAILFAYELPLLPPDTVYELWAITDGTPRAAGVFTPGPDGRARLEIADARLLADVDELAVTVEPAPGTDAPTSDPVLLSSS